MTTLTRDEIIVCLQKLNIPGITMYQKDGIQQACEMIMRLKEIEHLAWHIADSACMDFSDDECTVDKADLIKLCDLLPEEHPT